MLIPIHTKTFEKELEKSKKRCKDLGKIKEIMNLLIYEKPLLPKHKNHKLKGNYVGRWECHIEPDWLLIYIKTDTEITFERTGTHSDLF